MTTSCKMHHTHTHTQKVVDYITHWPLGAPVNIIDSHRILALPRALGERILFPVYLPPALPASLSDLLISKLGIIHRYLLNSRYEGQKHTMHRTTALLETVAPL